MEAWDASAVEIQGLSSVMAALWDQSYRACIHLRSEGLPPCGQSMGSLNGDSPSCWASIVTLQPIGEEGLAMLLEPPQAIRLIERSLDG